MDMGLIVLMVYDRINCGNYSRSWSEVTAGALKIYHLTLNKQLESTNQILHKTQLLINRPNQDRIATTIEFPFNRSMPSKAPSLPSHQQPDPSDPQNVNSHPSHHTDLVQANHASTRIHPGTTRHNTDLRFSAMICSEMCGVYSRLC